MLACSRSGRQPRGAAVSRARPPVPQPLPLPMGGVWRRAESTALVEVCDELQDFFEADWIEAGLAGA